ncbi:MAG TPA: fibronectin type III domain-containing protein, partial [Bacteroidia bacterium]|nr:fibronectin type III domain-containing protein [Bacteroidia bacterium]
MKQAITRGLPAVMIIIMVMLSMKLNGQTTTSIVPANAVFKYYDAGADPGTGWKLASFNDASWAQGAAELGFGDNPVTKLKTGKMTYYFRRTVNIATPSQYSSFIMKVRRDDGIIVYVNGTEVYRNNMPSGTVAYNTKASSTCSDDGASVLTTTLSNTLFIAGNNVIAAEVHNRSTGSSDITFELQLSGNSSGTGTGTCGVPNVSLFGTSNKTSTSAQPYWAAVSGATSYNVEYRIRNSGAGYSAPISTTNTSVVLAGLQPSTNYEFIVQTVCVSGSSAFSSSGWFTTLAATTACEIPAGLGVSSVTTTSATLNWNSVSGAISYTAQYRKSGTTAWTTVNATSNAVAVTGLVASTAYEFQVQTVCSSGNSGYSSASAFTTNGTAGTTVPGFAHIVVVIGENTNASSVNGSSAAPYINSLANAGAKFSNSYAITHPSQPNYLQLFSGSNQGVTNDNTPAAHFTTPNLARELVNAGKTFINYSEGLPSVGYDGSSSGLYVRKHNAVANWMGTGTNQVS